VTRATTSSSVVATVIKDAKMRYRDTRAYVAYRPPPVSRTGQSRCRAASVTAPEDDPLQSHPVLDTPPLPLGVSLAIWIVSALAVIAFGALMWLFWTT
jgi:hypothetical protein